MEPSPKPKRSLRARIFISLDEPRLRLGWRLAGQLALLVCFLTLFSCPFLFFLYQHPSTDALFMVDKVVGIFAITGSVFLARLLFDRRSLTSLGLQLKPRLFLDIIVGILIAGVMMGLIFTLEWGLGWLKFAGFAWQTKPISQVLVEILFWLLLFTAVGWQEELLARGYWLQNLADGMGLFWGVLLSSVLFSMAHLLNPNVSWTAVLGLVLAGLFLAYGYLRTRQLWLPIGLHIGWNFFEGTIFGFQVSGLSDMPVLLRQTVQGPELVTGGLFGPEAGLVILPAMALGVLLIYGYTRSRKMDEIASQKRSR
jgi:membrane protease YdiL (CAAX protease family)